MSRNILICTFFVGCVTFALVSADCITDIPYKAASKTLAASIGDENSSKPCRYGDNKALDDDCNVACKMLISATWGDCYCENPDYKPGSGHDLVEDLSVKEIFRLLATNDYALHATCRKWLNEPDNKVKWTCETLLDLIMDK